MFCSGTSYRCLWTGPKGLNGLGQVRGPTNGLITGHMVKGCTSVVIAMRANLTAKCGVIPVPTPILVIIGLVALNSRVLHLVLTQAARGCARGQGNSPPMATSGQFGPGGLANIPKLP